MNSFNTNRDYRPFHDERKLHYYPSWQFALALLIITVATTGLLIFTVTP